MSDTIGTDYVLFDGHYPHDLIFPRPGTKFDWIIMTEKSFLAASWACIHQAAALRSHGIILQK